MSDQSIATSRRTVLALGLGTGIAASIATQGSKNSAAQNTGSVPSTVLDAYSGFDSLSDFKSGSVPVIGGSLNYISAGQGGMTFVLLHKLGGWAAEWRWIAPLLAERVRIVAIDLAGHGRSSMQGEPPYIVTQYELAAQVMAILDALGEQRSVIVGSSLGGCVGVVCAAMWPDRFQSVVTVGSALGNSRPRSTLAESDANYVRRGDFDEDDNPIPRDPATMAEIFGLDDTHQEDMARSRSIAGRWIQPCTRGVAICDFRPFLSRISAPVLMMYGSRGNYGQFAASAVSFVPDGRTLELDDTSAFPHQDNPAETADSILKFARVL